MLPRMRVQLGALWMWHFCTLALSSLRTCNEVKEKPIKHTGRRLPRSVNSIRAGKMLSLLVALTTV